MNRLTEKMKNGTWILKGLPWEKIYPNKQVSFTQEEYEALYGALCKLKDYEDTGLPPDDVERVNNFERSQAGQLLLKLNQEQKKHQWIPADEPPETDRYILLSFANFDIPMVGHYEAGNKGGAYYVGDDDDSCISQGMIVSAWQPLPEPYRDDEDI